MANNFKIFGENTSNILTDAAFNTSAERQNGFQPNTTASSKSVNTALRESTLGVTALMNVILNSNNTSVNIGPNSTLNDVVNFITLGLNGFINSNISGELKVTTSSITGDTLSLYLGGTLKSSIVLTNVYHAATASSATIATNSAYAAKIGTSTSPDTVGSSTRPVYVSNGEIVQCSQTLGVDISGTAAKATRTSFTNNDFSYTTFSNGRATINSFTFGTYEIYIKYTASDSLSFGTHGLYLNVGETRYISSVTVDSDVETSSSNWCTYVLYASRSGNNITFTLKYLLSNNKNGTVTRSNVILNYKLIQ